MERSYVIPLRRQWRKTVRYRRAKKTIKAIREFLQKHMKAETIKVGKFLNEEVWKHGMKNPPSKIRVTAVKDKEGIVFVELFGKPFVRQQVEKKTTGIAAKIKNVVSSKKETPKKEVKKEVTVEKKPEIASVVKEVPKDDNN